MFAVVKHRLVPLSLACLFCLSGVVLGDGAELPVTLQRATARLTTTAFDEEETRRFFEHIFQWRRGVSGRVSAFGVVPAELERPALTEKNRLSALLHWESDLVCSSAEAGLYEFASTLPEVLWAVFIDGRYCGGWQDAVVSTVHLSAGVHRLQFIAVQNNEGAVAGLKMFRKESGEIVEQPLRLQAVPDFPFARLEGASADLRHYAADWQCKGRYHFLDTDQYLDWYQKKEGDKLAEGECFYLASDGKRLKMPATGDLYVDGRTGMSLEWKNEVRTEVFPAVSRWPLAVPVFVRVSLGEAQLFLSANEPVSVRIYQTWPMALPEELKMASRLRCRQYDGNGVLLSNELVSFGYQEELDCDMIPEASAEVLSWQAEIGGVAVSTSTKMRIVRPGKFPDRLEFCGNHLLFSGHRVVLRCDPLRRRADSGGESQRTLPELAIRLYYFEHDLGDTHAENGDGRGGRRTARLFRQMKGYSFGRILLPEISGAEPELQSVAAFAQLLSMRPEMAVLNLGERELKAGRTPLQLSRQMLFFSQASLAAGIEPILLTYPEMPGIDPAVSRQSALLIKELSLTLGVATADLYSQRIRENIDTNSWFVNAFAQHQTSNRKGRQWQAEKVIAALLGTTPKGTKNSICPNDTN